MKLIISIFLILIFCISCAPKKEALDKELIRSARVKNADDAEKALNQGADVNTKDEDGCTPLLIVSKFNISKGTMMLQLLLSKGADVNAKGKYGETALINAIYGLDQEAVDLLLKYGADPNIQDKNEWTALDYAGIADEKMKSNVSKHIIDELKKHGALLGAELKNEKYQGTK